jgi:ubiquinone/menaquinone biosynthesis C-methylase UbiE
VDHRRTVRDAYDEMADDYADRPEATSTAEPVARFLDGLAPDDRLLSAGCGGGDAPLAAAGTAGVGLDFSRAQLGHAAENVPDAALVQGDLTALPFADGAFDAVSALYSLIHVPVDDHETALGEFARVLRPGGTLLVTEGGVEWSGSNDDWLDSGTEMHWSMAGPEATGEHVAAAGFDVRGVWSVNDPTTDDDDDRKPFFIADLPG